MVSVTTAVQQKAQLIAAEASYDHAVHENWVVIGAVVAQNQSLIDLLQMTRFASAQYFVCVYVCQKSVV